MIPYGRQLIDDDDVQAVVSALRSDFLTQGPAVPQFERVVATYCGVAHAIAVNSATSALHVACLALGVGPGDRVWTSPNTFVASANCARLCGADVDFVDVDPESYNLSPAALAAKLEAAERDGTLPKVVIPVHFAGLPCDMAAIGALAVRYGFKVIEDASHAIGARHRGQVTGDCRFSDVSVFSFHPVKIVTTAEGGVATTKSEALARKMALFRAHGTTREASELDDSDAGPWYYEQHCLGLNYRMSELHAALGLSQFKHLDEWVARRHQLAKRYDSALQNYLVKLPTQPEDSYSALHLYPVQVAARRHVFDQMRQAGIGVNVHYIPVHLQPYYRALGFAPGDFPVSEAYYSRAISLPMFAALTDADQDRVVSALVAAIG